MKSQGWIKLHRKVTDNQFCSGNSERLGFWINLLVLANHKTNTFLLGNQEVTTKEGQFATGRKQLAQITGVSEMKVERWLTYMENAQQIVQQKHNKYRVITIRKWSTYQQDEQENAQQMNNRRTTDEQQMNTNKNDKNEKNDEIVSKDTMVKDRDQVIDFILDEFKKRFGAYPIDRKPRQVAYNIRQLATSFVKKYGEGYEKLRGTKLDVRSTILRAYDIYQQKESSQNIEYLDTFKRHMKKIFELTVAQMIKDGIIIS